MSLALASRGADGSSSLARTRTTLEQWVETRQLISKTRSDWQTDKETLEQTLQLYERELKSIEEQMSKVSTNNTQVDKERALAEDMGYDIDAVLDTNDLVRSDDCFFACTGITPGQLVQGVTFDGMGAITESLVMRSKSGTVRVIRARHRFTKLRQYASVAY